MTEESDLGVQRGFKVETRTSKILYFYCISIVILPILAGILYLTGIETIPEQMLFLVFSIIFLMAFISYIAIPFCIVFDAREIKKSPNDWNPSLRRYVFISLTIFFPPAITIFCIYYVARRYYVTGQL